MKLRLAVAVSFPTLLLFCTSESGNRLNEPLASAGLMSIRRLDVEAFDAVACFTPLSDDSFRLVDRDRVSGVLQTEAIYRKARWIPTFYLIRFGKQWKWKRRYFIARMYAVDVLQKKLGYSDAQIKRYYQKHRNEFRREGEAGGILPLDSVWFGVCRKMFLMEYRSDRGDDDLRSSSAFHRFITEGYRDYFMKKLYHERFRRPFPQPQSGKEIVKGLIDEDDVHSALPVLAPQERSAFENDPAPFLRSMMQWKLFSDKAIASGFTARREVRKTLEWALKIETAQSYIRRRFLPIIKKSASIDTALAQLSFFDDAPLNSCGVDTAAFRSHLARVGMQRMELIYDSLVFVLRRGMRVIFSGEEWCDRKGEDPVLLLEKADSLLDKEKESEAYDIYAVLAANYAFTPQGRRALLNLAAMQAENPDLREEAIRNYRRFLLNAVDPDEKCTALSAIGFVYDRYLMRQDLAELQYRWILKHVPDCPRTSDAEFMMQHLGEPFPSAEEMRNQTLRQGRKSVR